MVLWLYFSRVLFCGSFCGSYQQNRVYPATTNSYQYLETGSRMPSLLESLARSLKIMPWLYFLIGERAKGAHTLRSVQSRIVIFYIYIYSILHILTTVFPRYAYRGISAHIPRRDLVIFLRVA